MDVRDCVSHCIYQLSFWAREENVFGDRDSDPLFHLSQASFSFRDFSKAWLIYPGFFAFLILFFPSLPFLAPKGIPVQSEAEFHFPPSNAFSNPEKSGGRAIFVDDTYPKFEPVRGKRNEKENPAV